MEYSARTKENTEWVSVWIVNDAEFYEPAREAARIGAAELGEFLTRTLQYAYPESAAWYTAREMSENDYDRVDWAEIASDLLAE